jgi:PAS domain S-box-containing protein
MDLELRFTYLSPSIRFLTGYTAEEVMTMPPERILTPPSLALLQKTQTEMLTPPASRQNRSSDNATLVLEHFTKAGATVWAEVQITLLRDSQGQPQKLLGVARDITERRRAERALAEQYQFLQLLIDNIPSPVFFKDLNGLYRGCNKALGEFLGRPQEEIIGKTVFEIYPKELADKYLQMDQELFRHPGRQDYEFMMDKHDGARRAFIFTKATFGDSNGKVAGLIGVMTDITERKRSEEELKKANEQLKILVAQSEERNAS